MCPAARGTASVDESSARKNFRARFATVRVAGQAVREGAAGVSVDLPDGLLAWAAEVRVALVELVNPASGIHEAFLTRVERMGIRRDRTGNDLILDAIDHLDLVGTHGRLRKEASTSIQVLETDVVEGGMSFAFHGRIPEMGWKAFYSHECPMCQ